MFNYDNIFNSVVEKAYRTYETDGEHIPMLFSLSQGSLQDILPLVLVYQMAGKDQLPSICKWFLKGTNADAYILIQECFVNSVVVPEGETIESISSKAGPPSQSPNKVDSLLISLCSKEYNITRLYQVNPKVKELQLMLTVDSREPGENGGLQGGLMTGFLD